METLAVESVFTIVLRGYIGQHKFFKSFPKLSLQWSF